jgi:hypothetical protein
MSTIVTRIEAGGGATVKNAPLTNTEVDRNFINLNTDKVETSLLSVTALANTVVKRDAGGSFDANSISLTTPLSIASGGTGASTAATARDNLGLTLDITVQRYDASLESIRTDTGTGVVYRSGSGTTQTRATQRPQIQALGVGTAPSANTNDIRCTGEIFASYSDQRLKDDIKVIPDALDKVMQLSGVTYVPNAIAESLGFLPKKHVGVLAQDVEKVLPEAVSSAPFDIMLFEGTEISKSGQDYKTVQYERIIPLLIEAIKELNREVRELKGVK